MSEVKASLPPRVVKEIFVYLGCLIALLSLTDPNGGFMDIPMSFILKNQLGLSAQEIATFRLISSIPLYVSFLFGLFRDSLSAQCLRDREIIGFFSLANAALYLTLASLPVSYWTLFLATCLGTTLFLFVASAQSGLTAALAQQRGCRDKLVRYGIFLPSCLRRQHS